MLTPKQLERIPVRLVELVSQIETEMLVAIARRISKFRTVTGSIEYGIQKAQQFNLLYDDLVKIVSKHSGLQMKVISDMFEKAGLKSIEYDEKIYRKAFEAGLANSYPLTLKDSPLIQRVLQAGIQNAKSISNLTNTKAMNGALMAFNNAMDKAYLSVSSGATDFNTAYRIALKDLAVRGIRITEYNKKGGGTYSYSVEAATRRNILTTLNQTTQKMTEASIRQMQCKLVETSSHAGARPSHAEWQGQVFYFDEPVKGYRSFKEVCRYGEADGIGGVNCRHSFFPYYEGISTPSFDKDPAEELGIDNNELYKLEQKQRSYERIIRQTKKEIEVYKAGGDKELEKQARAKLEETRAKLRKFIKENTALVRDYSREAIQ